MMKGLVSECQSTLQICLRSVLAPRKYSVGEIFVSFLQEKAGCVTKGGEGAYSCSVFSACCLDRV